MPTSPAALIEQQQDAILQCCDTLLAAVSSGDRKTIGSCRSQLAAVLHANLMAEEELLNAPIRRMPPVSRPATYADLMLEAADLRARYTTHVGRWDLASATQDLDAYRADVAVLVNSVRQHLKRKRELIPSWLNHINQFAARQEG